VQSAGCLRIAASSNEVNYRGMVVNYPSNEVNYRGMVVNYPSA
jgi:hypothetical protein